MQVPSHVVFADAGDKASDAAGQVKQGVQDAAGKVRHMC